MLKLMNGFERPIVTSHVKIGVDDGSVFPVRRKVLDDDVQDIFFVPELMRSAQRNVVGIVAGHLERTLAVGQLAGMKHYIGARLHVAAEIVHQ